MKKQVKVALVTVCGGLVLLLLSIGSTSGAAQQRMTRIAPHDAANMRANGIFLVETASSGGFRYAGVLAADRFMRPASLDLDGAHKVRITKLGGGRAHLDRVALGGLAPVRLDGETTAAAALAGKDNVLAEVRDRMELSFPDGASGRLELEGRIEAKEIGKRPFLFPPRNLTEGAISARSEFYSYRVRAAGETAQAGPLFSEYCMPVSGHPNGMTVCTVDNDGQELRVRLDFTPDNTLDGDTDYASLFVKQGGTVREFRISENAKRWGEARFQPSGNAAYPHKVYEFRIPVSEIGARPGEVLELAFSAYGTAAAGDYFPRIVRNARDGGYLVAYVDMGFSPAQLRAQRLDDAGLPVGAEISVMSNHAVENYNLAYDAVRNRYLFVWQDMRDGNENIFGQLVGADGVLVGTNIPICRVTNGQYSPAVVNDPLRQVYLVVWTDYRNESSTEDDIYARFVSLDGVPCSNDFVVNNGVDSQTMPALAFDPVSGKFLVAWTDYREGPMEIYGQLLGADGSKNGAMLEITDAVNNQIRPAVVADPFHGQFLVSWEDQRASADRKIWMQRVTTGGVFAGTNCQLSVAGSNDDSHVHAANDWQAGRTLLAWNRTAPYQVDARLVDGTDPLAEAVFTVLSNAGGNEYPAVVFNPLRREFLVACTAAGSSPPAIGLLHVPAGNAPPSKPVLLSPADSSAVNGPTATLSWNPSVDPEGTAVSYKVYLSTNAGFSNCTPVTVAAGSSASVEVFAAGAVFGLVALGGLRRRGGRLLFVGLCLLCALFAACGDDDDAAGNSSTTGGTVTPLTWTADGLESGRTYYWKVTASDGVDERTSDSWSFTVN